jgi:hypothetical protein
MKNEILAMQSEIVALTIRMEQVIAGTGIRARDVQVVEEEAI